MNEEIKSLLVIVSLLMFYVMFVLSIAMPNIKSKDRRIMFSLSMGSLVILVSVFLLCIKAVDR